MGRLGIVYFLRTWQPRRRIDSRRAKMRVKIASWGRRRDLMMYCLNPATGKKMTRSAETADHDEAQEAARAWQGELDRQRWRELARDESPAPRRIKIGFTSWGSKRVLHLMSISPVRLELFGFMAGPVEVEGELHRRFDRHRVRFRMPDGEGGGMQTVVTEWFREHADLTDWILANAITSRQCPYLESRWVLEIDDTVSVLKREANSVCLGAHPSFSGTLNPEP